MSSAPPTHAPEDRRARTSIVALRREVALAGVGFALLTVAMAVDGARPWMVAAVIALALIFASRVLPALRELEHLVAANASLQDDLAHTTQEFETQAVALAYAEELAANIVEGVTHGIVAFDVRRRFTAWNATMARLYGRSAAEVIGRTLDELYPALAAEGLAAVYDAALAGETRTVANRTILNRTTGATVLVDATYAPLRARDGTVVGGIGVLHDVTESRREEEQLRAWSMRDPLTGLLNRRGFTSAAEERLAATLASGGSATLLYCDLNDFKAINDTFGHDVGDDALVEAAALLRDTLGHDAPVARLGGDEFAALALGSGGDGAHALAARLTDALAARNARSDRRFALSMSVGAVVAARGDTLATLLKAADRSLYVAKARKRAGGAALHPPLRFHLGGVMRREVVTRR